MYYDAYGNPHESWPGELSGRMQPRQQGQQSQMNQQQAQAPAQTQQNFVHRQCDIIFVDSREDVEKISVNPGYDQVFAAKDDSFFAVKSAVGNSSTTVFYQMEKPKPPQTVDMSAYVKRDEVASLVSATIMELMKQQGAQSDGAV